MNTPQTTILLVDDSIVARNRLKQALTTEGYRVLEAGNGAEGLEVSRTEDVSLMLVDLNMPVMNGIDMVREVRALEKYTGTPIFMLTSETLNLHAAEAKEVGINAWIVKPVKNEALLAAVKRGVALTSKPASPPRAAGE